ncbi:hypothetical protein J6590_088062 [Homalodisca vitripennis]|nr:hypothetical protein J6590_088062 [Homalodisca vitripennis]
MAHRATRAARKNRERVYPRGLSLYPSSLGPDLRTPSTGNQTCRGPTVAMQSPTSASMAHFLTKARRGWLLASYQRKHHRQVTPRVLRYAPVKKKEEVTPTWGRRKEEVGEICPEKIKDVKLRSEREKKDLSSRRTAQVAPGSPASPKKGEASRVVESRLPLRERNRMLFTISKSDAKSAEVGLQCMIFRNSQESTKVIN